MDENEKFEKLIENKLTEKREIVKSYSVVMILNLISFHFEECEVNCISQTSLSFRQNFKIGL
jgi:hypothetical protein